MTILQHIKSLTQLGLNPTGNPSISDLESFLHSTIKEIITNTLKFSPESGFIFTSESDEQDSNGFKVDSGVIYAVVREDGTDNRFRPARQIDITKEYLVTDTDSLFYASKYNPVYVRDDDNTINVYPVPNSSQETFKVTYIDYPKYDNFENILSINTDLDDAGIKNFPDAFHAQLILGMSIKALNSYHNSLLVNDEDAELAQAISSRIQQMNNDYIQSFLTKDVLVSQEKESRKKDRKS
tara:strand:- start:2080 stop:2796 length:717 start_codon:yes stop_codon:yes gene_type:complete